MPAVSSGEATALWLILFQKFIPIMKVQHILKEIKRCVILELNFGGKMNCVINIVWDDEAAVWIATSEDVPGLVLENGSLDALMERARFAIPELLELNSKKNSQPIPLIFRSERREALVV